MLNVKFCIDCFILFRLYNIKVEFIHVHIAPNAILLYAARPLLFAMFISITIILLYGLNSLSLTIY